jgi:hypothetical protein
MSSRSVEGGWVGYRLESGKVQARATIGADIFRDLQLNDDGLPRGYGGTVSSLLSRGECNSGVVPILFFSLVLVRYNSFVFVS